jgi:hypothetical protein
MIIAARQRRRGLTDKMIAALRRKAKRYIISDPEIRGHYVRVPPQGPVVFTAVARDPYGKQVWATLGSAAELKIDDARNLAQEAIRRIKAGKSAIEPRKPKPASVAVVAANWLTRHVEKNKMRTEYEQRRIVEKYILPYWADQDFVEIRRADIAMLLDMVEDKHGPAMADAVLTTLRSIASWVQPVTIPTFRLSPKVCGVSRNRPVSVRGCLTMMSCEESGTLPTRLGALAPLSACCS